MSDEHDDTAPHPAGDMLALQEAATEPRTSRRRPKPADDPFAPSDRDAERAMLAAALMHPGEAKEILALVPREAWGTEAHREIADTMRGIVDAGVVLEPFALLAALRDAQRLEHVGGVNAISQILDAWAPRAEWAWIGRRLHRKALERRLLATWQGGVIDIVGGDAEACALRSDQAREILADIAAIDSPDVTSADKLAAHVERMRNPEQRTVHSTGIRSLDERLDGGLSPGHVCVVLGEPNKGKTALVGGITLAMMRAGGAVLAFSEMSEDEMLARWLAGESGVPLRAQKRGDLTGWQWSDVSGAVDRMSRWRFDVRPIVPFAAMADAARAYKRKHPLAAIVVDYLQLVDNGSENRVQDIERTTRGLKLLAAELGVVVFELSQPDKASAKSGELGMSSSRGASSIEADCDLMLIPLRDDADPSRAGLKLAKWKHGPKRDIELGALRFNGARMVFEEV